MPQVLPVHHFSLHLPKLTPARIVILEFAIAGIAVLALAVALSILFPIGSDSNGWDAATYLAAV